MKRGTTPVSLFVGLCLILSLAACGGDGDDGGGGPSPANTGLRVEGSTWAPNGSLAKAIPKGLFERWFAWLLPDEALAQAARQPLTNTRLVVFRINKDGSVQTSTGNPTGVVAESKTDAAGRFSFFLPVGTGFSSDLIVQASDTAPGTAPTPIGNARSLNAPVTGPAVNINPITEAAVRELVAHAQPLSGSLPSLYANQETSSFLASLDALAGATGADLQDMITNVQTANAPLIAAGLDLLDEPGQVDQSTVAGSYAVAGYFVDADNTGLIKRYTHSGAATFDNASGRFQYTLQVNGAQTAESCSAACSRTFTRSPYATGQFSVGGAYLYYPTRHELFMKSDTQQVEVVKINTSENVMLFPQGWVAPIGGFPFGFTVAVRKGSGVTANDLGPGINLFGLEASLNPSAPASAGSWAGPVEALILNGGLTFAPPTVTVTATGDSMHQDLTCTLTPTGCTVTANVTQTVDDLSVPNLPFTVASDGSLTLNPGPDSIQGTVDRSKTIIMFPGNTSDGASITFGTRQVGNLTAASLNGTYYAVLMREKMDRSGRMTTDEWGGTITLNNGTMTFTQPGPLHGNITYLERRETCPSAATCAIQTIGAGAVAATFTGTYSMDPGARVRLTFASEFGEYIAGVAPDTSFIHGAATRNGVVIPGQPQFSERSMILMLKQ